jgi:ABC-type Fe3+-hydroxamate transport system substrate-binding protein
MIDDRGRTVHLPARPRRIVSLVPSLTELLFAVGAGEALVGVTRYCIEPPDRVASLPKVGGTKNPDLVAIHALTPDLVIVNGEENRYEDFAALDAAGLTVFVTEPKTVADAVALIARLAAAVGAAEAGRRLAASQAAGVAAVVADTVGCSRVAYFCPIWKRPWMTFNADTYAHDVLRVAGGANVAAGRPERYPEVTLVEVAAAAPAVVLLPDEPYRFGNRDVASLDALADTPALRDGRVHLVDGKALSWYGPRIAAGVAMFARLFAAARADRGPEARGV